jgi:epoxyqueuosine reductase
MLQSWKIKDLAFSAGFDLCGITSCRHFAENEHYFREWLSAGYGADLGYLERNIDKRFDVAQLFEGAKSIIVCAVNYKSPRSLGYPTDSNTKVASYACNCDYHTTLKEMLSQLYSSLKEVCPDLRARAFTDSAPLLEKQLAVEAGLGWIGRQSLLITPEFGSFVLLAELVVDQEVDCYDTPFEGSRCGECLRCVEACPNSAILPTKCIDARRCISRLTIENEPSVTDEKIVLNGWIFGCDECQSCCPHNRATPYATNPNFYPALFDPAAISAEQWLTMADNEFVDRFGSTPLMRSGLQRLQKNINIKD